MANHNRHRNNKSRENRRTGNLYLGSGTTFSADSHRTGVNNNLLIVGTSGCGKTRGVASPAILAADCNYIVSDPKGQLSKKYADYLRMKGYKIQTLNLIHPERSDHYDPFAYVHTEQDILKFAHMIIYGGDVSHSIDPYWDMAAEVLLSSLVSYLIEKCELDRDAGKSNVNFQNIAKLSTMTECTENETGRTAPGMYDILINDIEYKNPDSFAASQWKKARVNSDKTMSCIRSTLDTAIGTLDTSALRDIFNTNNKSNTITFKPFANNKVAVFVVASDSDRSMDTLANLFFMQALNELTLMADDMPNGELNRHTRFILDDFATNVKIADFPRIIASMRSRNLSATLMIQAIHQLKGLYGQDGMTIVSNCDTIAFMGTGDVETCNLMADMMDMSFIAVQRMPIGHMLIYRRGEKETFECDAVNLNRLEEWCINKKQDIKSFPEYSSEEDAKEKKIIGFYSEK